MLSYLKFSDVYFIALRGSWMWLKCLPINTDGSVTVVVADAYTWFPPT